jgi:hypothetical protein
MVELQNPKVVLFKTLVVEEVEQLQLEQMDKIVALEEEMVVMVQQQI